MAVLLLPATAFTDSLIVGFNTQTPLQVYSVSGAYQQDFGPAGASAGVEENGLLYIVQPNISGTTSTITALNGEQSTIASFIVADLIGDGAPGLNGSLWLAGYDGTVYNVSATGQVLSSFTTGYSNIGIASNGSTLYTTEGDGGDGIDVRNASGTVLSTLHTGISSLYGLGYESSNSDLFAGGFNFVYQFDKSGNLISTLNIPGDSRTPNGAVHDGLEIGDLTQLSMGDTIMTPEPGTWSLSLVMVGVSFLYWQRRRICAGLPWAKVCCALIGFVGMARGSVTVTINASATGGVPVGTPISLSATASDSAQPSAVLTYQYNVQAPGSNSFALLKDYYSTKTFTWAPTAREGVYVIQVNVQSSSGDTGSAQLPISVVSRVMGSTPVVSATQNPLVALYSAPPCAGGSRVRVRFKGPGATIWQATPYQNCNGFSLNFLIAGMTASTTYQLQQDQYRGPFNTPGPVLSFTTGAIPSSVTIPAHATRSGPIAPTSMSFPFVLYSRSFYPFATDLNGNVVWYLAAYSYANPHEQGALFRNTNSGTVLGAQDDPNDPCPGGTTSYCGDLQFLREWDLAGNIVRETNWTILNKEVNAMRAGAGFTPVNLSDISHEATRLANGYTVITVGDQRIADQGQGPVVVDGDAVIVLDTNFQPTWFWTTFDHIDITRKALMNEICVPGQGGCAVSRLKQANGQYYTVANDWTHVNSVTIDSRDGNLVVSSRHQSQVWKLAYLNGTGDGHIIWTLGIGGDFSLPPGVPDSVWFSYQHDAQFQASGLLTLFDNNNLQHLANGANSRGQAFSLDESRLVATPVLNVDLGAYSAAVGYASQLSNGNYDFGAGFLNNATAAQTSEYTPDGTLVYDQFVQSFSYRPIRLPDFYTER